MDRKASANWKGALKTGTGTVSSASGVLSKENYGFNKRFGDEPGTNPEELIAAAHASCFSMALSMILGQHEVTPDDISTEATVTLVEKDGGFAVTKSHLDVTITADADEATLMEAATTAKENCPISKLLNAEITMDARKA